MVKTIEKKHIGSAFTKMERDALISGALQATTDSVSLSKTSAKNELVNELKTYGKNIAKTILKTAVQVSTATGMILGSGYFVLPIGAVIGAVGGAITGATGKYAKVFYTPGSAPFFDSKIGYLTNKYLKEKTKNSVIAGIGGALAGVIGDTAYNAFRLADASVSNFAAASAEAIKELNEW